MTRLDESTLHALVDGQLSAGEAARVETALQDLPEQLAMVQTWRAQRAGLQRLAEAAEKVDATTAAALLARLVDEPDPATARVLEFRPRRPATASPWRRHAAAAAIAVLSCGVGWFGRGVLTQRGDRLPGDGSRSSAAAADSASLPGFVREASSAYAVFTPEVRHPVEVGANEQAHLVQWLSRRLGRPLRLPDLAPQGYQLLGGRLLPAADGMGAMFMYQAPAGERLSLYMTVLGPGDSPGDTAFRFSESSAAPTFYWVDRDFGYAVSAKLPREQIMAIARSVYTQTVEAPPAPK